MVTMHRFRSERGFSVWVGSIGGVPWKKYELILRAAAEIFARQLPPSGTADLTFLTISSFSSQLRWLCSASPSLAANFF